jgi:hypothetical protein
LTEDDLEDITKEWSADLLVPADPIEMSDVDIPKTMADTPGPSKTKKIDEMHDVHSTSVETSSTSCEKGDDGGELGGMEVEKNKGEVTLPRDEEDPNKKRKVTSPNPSSQKKARATRATFKTTLTSDDFDFLVAALNDSSLEIEKNQEAKQEEVFSQIKGELREVQHALQSSHVVSIAPSTSGTKEPGDEPTQLHQIANKVEDRLRRA